MPECRCRTEAADYRKKCRCRTNFSLAFRHLYMIFQYHIARITPPQQLSMDAQGVSLSTTGSLESWTCTGFPFHYHQKQLLKIPECRTVRHPVSPVPEWIKIPMPEPVRYRNKGTKWSSIGMLRYRTVIQNAGMSMPAASTSMPMPSCGYKLN